MQDVLDPANPSLTKTLKPEDFQYSLMLYSIKGLLKVQFDDHQLFLRGFTDMKIFKGPSKTNMN
jgi:hypothetical protein